MCGQGRNRPRPVAMFTLLLASLVNVRGECVYIIHTFSVLKKNELGLFMYSISAANTY